MAEPSHAASLRFRTAKLMISTGCFEFTDTKAVIPAKAGTHSSAPETTEKRIRASAGMTIRGVSAAGLAPRSRPYYASASFDPLPPRGPLSGQRAHSPTEPL